jgi:hypothetical protein
VSSSTNPRLKRSLFVCSAADGETDRLLKVLEAEQIQCVIDLRPVRLPGAEGTLAALRLGAESREIYYAHLPELTAELSYERGQPPRPIAWVARTALRHRTCLVIRGTFSERHVAQAVAELVGLRVIDLDEPRRRSAADRPEEENAPAR